MMREASKSKELGFSGMVSLGILEWRVLFSYLASEE